MMDTMSAGLMVNVTRIHCLCQCLPGFVPKSHDVWALRDTSDGCSRKTALACPNGTDGFMKLSNVKLPETLTAKIDASFSLDEGRTNCFEELFMHWVRES